MNKSIKKTEKIKKSLNNIEENSYTAKDIYVLEGLEPVRRRPGMYIGSTGPEGLHHLIWECVDNSLTYNTPVLIKQDGRIGLKKIGEVVDKAMKDNNPIISYKRQTEILRSDFDIETLSFNFSSLKLDWVSVSSLIRHKVNSEILEITLQNNRKVCITPYHSLFTLEQGKMVPISGSNIEIGTNIVVPKVFPEPESCIEKINILQELEKLSFEKTKSINFYQVKPLLKDDFKVFVKKYCSDQKIHRSWSNIFYDFRRYDYLPFNIWRYFPADLKEKFKGCLIGNKRNDGFKIKTILPVDKNLIELLGIYTAEGTNLSGKTNRIVFSFGSHEKLFTAYTINLIQKVFNYKANIHYSHETANTIQIDSLIISLIFKEILKTGNNSHKKVIPSLVFNVDSYLRERYLIAYLAGDGYPSKEFIAHLINNSSPGFKSFTKFTAVSASGDLISGISYILFSLGKTFSVGEMKQVRERQFRINYHGKIKVENCSKKTYAQRIDFYWNSNASYINSYPTREIISQINWQEPCSFSINTRGGVSREKVLALCEKERITLYPDASKFLDSDLAVLKVTKIKKIKYENPWVYDFSVPQGENFVGGFAPIVCHNSIDEAMGGYAKNINVEILKEEKVAVADDGRGIPVDIHKKTKKSALETVMCTLHAGGKFGGTSYKVAGGLHGVGISVVNALSIYLQAEICRDGILYSQEYNKGKPTTKLKKIGKCNQSGTKIIFEPDPEIFKEIKFDTKKILDHLRQQAYLTSGTTIKFKDYREGALIPSYAFYFESGIITLVKYLARDTRCLTNNVFYVKQEKEEILVEVALLYTDDSESTEKAFANNIHTPEGGMHLTGFRSALTRTLNDYAKEQGIFKNGDIGFTGEDTREGLVVVISVKLREPQFEGQTKAKLGNPEARTAVEQVVGENFKEFLEANKEDAKRILEKSLLSARARQAAKKARENILRKGVLEGMTLPGKLADCISKNAEESELFIVEGDSAGGCFSGDTKIALLDGRNISFKQLVEEHKQGKRNYCYTIEEDGHIRVSLIENPRKTKTNASVIKVLLDNDEEIVCTSNHKFMLRNGSYKEAKDLIPEDSLMPLYRKYSEMGHSITIDGYEMVFDSIKNKWIFTHLLSDIYNLQNDIYLKDDGCDKHHIDFNKLNNNPDNITRMEKEGHMAYHRKMAKYSIHSESSKEKARQAHKSIEYREKIRKIMSTPEMKKMLSERAKKQWQNEEYKNYMAQNFLEFYNSNAKYRVENKKNLNLAQKRYWADWQNREKQSKRVKQYFENHPEKKMVYSELAKKQWDNLDLRNWRSEMTKKQWTEEFRKKRRISYNKTYVRKCLEVLHEIYQKDNKIDKDAYCLIRKNVNDKSLIRYDTICQRFFEGDEKKLQEAVVNYNHRIKGIILLKKKIDVYDIEVAGTHNFALASGVFVHNSSKMGRNRNTQAILPLKGKILNVEKSRFDRMMTSEEIKALIVALGTAISEDFNIDKLRYHKVVIMTDADSDGAHIRSLLLTLFFRYFKSIIEAGYLYIAQPPLYRIQKGKEFHYAYTEAEKQKVLERIQGKTEEKKQKSPKSKIRKLKLVEEGKNEATLAVEEEEFSESTHEELMKGISIQRYKGLGEMNPDQLWDTTMDPEKRILKQVTIEDAEEADRLFDILMGKEVLPRKKFIQAYAKKVKNLDI